MRYLIDTNTCIYLFRGDLGVLNKLNNVGIANCFILDLTVFELLVGAEHQKLKLSSNDEYIKTKRFVNQVSVLHNAAYLEGAAREKARMLSEGKPNGDDIDLIIGYTSVAEKMTMVTDNIKHFENIRGIRLENWVTRE